MILLHQLKNNRSSRPPADDLRMVRWFFFTILNSNLSLDFTAEEHRLDVGDAVCSVTWDWDRISAWTVRSWFRFRRVGTLPTMGCGSSAQAPIDPSTRRLLLAQRQSVKERLQVFRLYGDCYIYSSLANEIDCCCGIYNRGCLHAVANVQSVAQRGSLHILFTRLSELIRMTK